MSPMPAHNRGMTNTMRRIRRIRTCTNVCAAVLLLIAATAVAAQVLGLPDVVLPGSGEEGAGILTMAMMMGIAVVLFGTPVVLAVNLLHWAAEHRYRRTGVPEE